MQPRFIGAISLQEFADEIAAAWPSHKEESIDVPSNYIESEYEYLSNNSFEDYMEQLGFTHWVQEGFDHFMKMVEQRVDQPKALYDSARNMLVEECEEDSSAYPLWPLLYYTDTNLTASADKTIHLYVKKFVEKYGDSFLRVLQDRIGAYPSIREQFVNRIDPGEELVMAQVDSPERKIGAWFMKQHDFFVSPEWGNGAIDNDAGIANIILAVLRDQVGVDESHLDGEVRDLLKDQFIQEASIDGYDAGVAVETDKLIFEYLENHEDQVLSRVGKDSSSLIEKIAATEAEHQAKWRWKMNLTEEEVDIEGVNSESSFADIGTALVRDLKLGKIDVHDLYEKADMFYDGDFKDVYFVLEEHSSNDDVEIPATPTFNQTTMQLDVQPQNPDMSAVEQNLQPQQEPFQVGGDERAERVMNANKAEDEVKPGTIVLYRGEPVKILGIGDGYLRYEIEDKHGKQKFVEKAELQPFDTDPLRLVPDTTAQAKSNIKFKLGDAVATPTSDKAIIEVIEIFGGAIQGGIVEYTCRTYNEDGDVEEDVYASHDLTQLARGNGLPTPDPKFPVGTEVVVANGKYAGAVGTVGYMYNRIATDDDVEFKIAKAGTSTGWRCVVDFEKEPEGYASESFSENDLAIPDKIEPDENVVMAKKEASGTGYADYEEKNTDSAGTGMSGNVVSTHVPDVAQQVHSGETQSPVPSQEYEENMKRNRDIKTKLSLGTKKIDHLASEIVREITANLKKAQTDFMFSQEDRLKTLLEQYRFPLSKVNWSGPDDLQWIIEHASDFCGVDSHYVAGLAKKVLEKLAGRQAQVNIVGTDPKPPVGPSLPPTVQQVSGQPLGGAYTDNEAQQKEEDAEQAAQQNMQNQSLQQQKEFQNKSLEMAKTSMSRQIEAQKIRMLFGTTPNFENPSSSSLSQMDDDNSQVSGSDHGRKVFLGEKYEDDDVENATFPRLNKDLQPKV